MYGRKLTNIDQSGTEYWVIIHWSEGEYTWIIT